MVQVSPVFVATWMENLRPVKGKLLGPLIAIFRDRRTERSAERALATDILADYASDQPDTIADLVLDADERQFVTLFAKLAAYPDAAIVRFEAELAKPALASVSNAERDGLGSTVASAC